MQSRLKFLCEIIITIYFVAACSSFKPQFDSRNSTPTPVVVRFEIQGDDSFDDPQPSTPITFRFGPTDTPSPTATSQPALQSLVADTPELQSDQAQMSPMFEAEPAQEAGSLGEQPISAADRPAVAPAGDTNVYSGPLTSAIIPVDPLPGLVLPVGVDQLEVKWEWHGEQIRPCQLPDGHGFSIRVWASPTNPLLPEPVRRGIEPLGVADFVAIQPEITNSCDPKTSQFRYTITDLKTTQGVSLVGGSGHFFWDVAYAQLKPYYVVLGVSAPRDFFIPAAGPPPDLSQPSPPPTPAFPLTPQPRPGGTITLLKPDDGAVFPIDTSPAHFEWRWEGETLGPCNLAAGYGFEMRLWSKQADFTPLGVFDAAKDQHLVECDPTSGVYSLLVPDLKNLKGVVATYKGEYRWDGQFWWDVALVSISPYLPPESASPPRSLALSLENYNGTTDWFGRDIRCSQIVSWPEAQAIFLKLGGPHDDPNGLDPDGNGVACDELRQ